ncbi:MAG TPA: CapA family protein [bacterium]|nr:CapA family protein [bacterium]
MTHDTERSIILRAVGDVALIGCAAEALEKGSDPAWSATAAFLAEADITFANFEMAIPRTPVERVAVDVSPDLIGRPDALGALLESGLDVAAVATNHIMDWGETGLRETLEQLREHNVTPVGAGADLDEAVRGVVVERRGVRVGFCAFTPEQRWTATRATPGAAPLKLEHVKESLSGMDSPDVRVVSLHWGIEMSNYPTPEDRKLARDIVDAGADLILGHHPHVIQGYENVRGSFVVYSMGNFAFDIHAGRIEHKFDPRDLRSAYLLEARLGADGVESVNPVAVAIGESGLGALAEGEDRRAILRRIKELSDSLDAGSAAVWEHAGGRLVGHRVKAVRTTLRDGGVIAVLREFRHFRWKHVKLIFGFLRSRFARR